MKKSRTCYIFTAVLCFLCVTVPGSIAQETEQEHAPIEAEVNRLFSKLRVSSSVDREELIHELFMLGETAEKTVYDYLVDKDKSIVIVAIRFLSFVQSEKAKNSLLKLTIHPNWEIRAMSLIALGNFSSDDVVARISDSLFLEKNRSVQEAAAYSLCIVRNANVSPVFFRAMKKFNGKMRDICLAALQRYLQFQDFSVEVVSHFKKHENGLPLFVKMEVLKKVGDMSDRRTRLFFEEKLNSPENDLRALAAMGLGKIGDTRSIKALYRKIDDPAGSVREHAKASLFRMTNFTQWGNRFAVEDWMTKNENLLNTVFKFEGIIEQAMGLDYPDWGNLLSEISLITAQEGNGKIFSDFIVRCILSKNKKTNEFAINCFSRFKKELQPSIRYLLEFGSSKALVSQDGLFHACELASVISYRYGIFENIPLMIAFLENVEKLSAEQNVLLSYPVSYLCLKGMSSANLPDRTIHWKRWWRRNSKKIMARKAQ